MGIEPVGPLSGQSNQSQPVDPGVFKDVIQKSQALQGQMTVAVAQGTDQGVQATAEGTIPSTIRNFDDLPIEVRNAFMQTMAWDIIHSSNASDRRLKEIWDKDKRGG